MHTSYQNIFAEEGIFLCESLPFTRCRVVQPHKLERLGFLPSAAIVFLMPYAVKITGERNLSRYAVAKDYHRYVKELEARLIGKFSLLHPEARFRVFSDNSPIDERHAAALCGLGVLGDNGLILSERYGSYVFIGEVLTDLPIEVLGEKASYEIKTCRHCGACTAACPKKDVCLSALTQKKGILTVAEASEICALGSVWGCDRCQEVCPYNDAIEETPIDFFKRDLVPYLTVDLLLSMSDDAFMERAYAWRGRNTILRNLELVKKSLEST